MAMLALYAAVQVRYRFFQDITLKTQQVDVLEKILDGKDCIVQLPTGYGKSLLYVLPPLLLDEVCMHGNRKKYILKHTHTQDSFG